MQNASWVASGLSSLVLLVSIILCVKASKNFLRAKKTGVFNKLGMYLLQSNNFNGDPHVNWQTRL